MLCFSSFSQFEEFIDVACLSDVFKFKMTPEVKLAVRAVVVEQRDQRWREELIAEQKAMLALDVEGKVTALEKQAKGLSGRLTAKAQEATMLEGLLQEQKGVMEKQTKQIRDAAAELEACMEELDSTIKTIEEKDAAIAASRKQVTALEEERDTWKKRHGQTQLKLAEV